ncbi:MAG TPA: DinB family protein [Terriglobales bacterium]|nr:DinB family protein [Terriglobales bacterium]
MKKMKWILASLLLLTWSHLAPAQMDKPAQLTTRQVLDAWITNTENHLVPVANAMPEDKYPFAPSHGEFNNVRTFAEQLKHLAANNYRQAAVILGDKPTADQISEQGPDSVKTKAEIVDYLEGSFASLHKAVAAINENNQVEPITGTSGTWQRARLGLAIDAVAHSFDHYGQLVEYLRMNGIVPPDSR